MDIAKGGFSTKSHKRSPDSCPFLKIMSFEFSFLSTSGQISTIEWPHLSYCWGEVVSDGRMKHIDKVWWRNHFTAGAQVHVSITIKFSVRSIKLKT